MKNIVVIGTGGTIAGVGESALQTSGYVAGSMKVSKIIEQIPSLERIANISAIDFCQMDSVNMNEIILLELSKKVQEVIDKDNVDGIVISHGTDTLEETAYFLNLTVHTKKPIVITGAMVPSTAIGADGPLNLKNSIYAASSDKLYGLGVVVCLDQGITSARNVTKTNAIQYGTFNGRAAGFMGYVTDKCVEVYQVTNKIHTYNSEFNIEKLVSLPRVEILYMYGMVNVNVVDYYVNEEKVDGLIIAATGDGSIPNILDEKIKKYNDKIIFVRSSRTGDGIIIRNGEYDDDKYKTLTANNLNPQKARILLAIALTKTKNVNELQRIMDEY